MSPGGSHIHDHAKIKHHLHSVLAWLHLHRKLVHGEHVALALLDVGRSDPLDAEALRSARGNGGLRGKHKEFVVRRSLRRLAVFGDFEFLQDDFDRHRRRAVIHHLNVGARIRADRNHFQ